jgi:hypothetical protein
MMIVNIIAKQHSRIDSFKLYFKLNSIKGNGIKKVRIKIEIGKYVAISKSTVNIASNTAPSVIKRVDFKILLLSTMPT